MSGYAPHPVQDFEDEAFGDVLAAKLSAVHCSYGKDARCLDYRIQALAARLPGMTLQPALEQELEERVALLAYLIGQLEDRVPN